MPKHSQTFVNSNIRRFIVTNNKLSPREISQMLVINVIREIVYTLTRIAMWLGECGTVNIMQWNVH